jgi:hypothetical protein
MDEVESLWFGSGFLAISFGNALGAVHMFRGNVPVVMASVALMFAGYQVLHYAAHGEGMVSLSWDRHTETGVTGATRSRGVPVVLLVVAVYCIAQGFVIGAQAAVSSFTLFDMGATGAFIVGGYMTGHAAVHGVPL